MVPLRFFAFIAAATQAQASTSPADTPAGQRARSARAVVKSASLVSRNATPSPSNAAA